ncbi:haloacid dehalogenase-like hydrolase [Biscogniauxia mediterranea]|nr:haloacid dehalogenase-like hydrolase [Biscogniauxia mediterranea]
MRRFLSTLSKMSHTRARRFAPLGEGPWQESDLPKLQGIIFDVDGTLCKPQNHMFREMRRVLSIPAGADILEHVYGLPTAAARESAMSRIRAIERRGMAEQVAQPGLARLMAHLDARGVRKAICTRNFEQPVAHLLARFLAGSVFHPVVTRRFRPPKPDPAGLLFIAHSWGLVTRRKRRRTRMMMMEEVEDAGVGVGVVNGHHDTTKNNNKVDDDDDDGYDSEEYEVVGDGSNLIMVGDSLDDMTAGRRAGAATVLLVNDANRHLAEHEHTDLVIERLDELIDVLDRGFVGREVPKATE